MYYEENEKKVTGGLDIRIVIWVCSLLSIVATFLPFITASAFGFSESVTMAESDGAAVLVYLLAIVASVLAVFPKARKFTMIPAILLLIYLLMVAIAANDASGYGESVSMGIGFWIMFAGNIIILISAIRYHRIK